MQRGERLGFEENKGEDYSARRGDALLIGFMKTKIGIAALLVLLSLLDDVPISYRLATNFYDLRCPCFI
jgi:hypothetical protein